MHRSECMQFLIRDTRGSVLIAAALDGGDGKPITLAKVDVRPPHSPSLNGSVPFRGNFTAGHALLRKEFTTSST